MSNIQIFTFVFYSDEGVTVSNRVAKWLSDLMRWPLTWREDQLPTEPLDVLVLVGGTYTFCKCLQQTAPMIERAERIIWLQNDYTVYPPIDDGAAQSPFRRAFVRRREQGKAPVDYWTTCREYADKTPQSRLINWNQLMWKPDVGSWSPDGEDLFYYGSYRKDREVYFDKYFLNPTVPVWVSAMGKKFDKYRSDKVYVEDRTPLNRFFVELGRHGLGLYIEDRRSHVRYHSPSSRFYEMLSAGLPMVFDSHCEGMLKRAGVNTEQFQVSVPSQLPRLMERRHEMGVMQRDMWWKDYRSELTLQVLDAWRDYR